MPPQCNVAMPIGQSHHISSTVPVLMADPIRDTKHSHAARLMGLAQNAMNRAQQQHPHHQVMPFFPGASIDGHPPPPSTAAAIGHFNQRHHHHYVQHPTGPYQSFVGVHHSAFNTGAVVRPSPVVDNVSAVKEATDALMLLQET